MPTTSISCNLHPIGTIKLVGFLWDCRNFNRPDSDASTGYALSAPAQVTATAIDINWDAGGPNTVADSDIFSARWHGSFAFAPGTYTFTGEIR